MTHPKKTRNNSKIRRKDTSKSASSRLRELSEVIHSEIGDMILLDA